MRLQCQRPQLRPRDKAETYINVQAPPGPFSRTLTGWCPLAIIHDEELSWALMALGFLGGQSHCGDDRG